MGKEATVMVGGHGQNSYMHNSIHQRTRYDTVVNMVEEVIHERLHIPTKGGTIRVADLGCSVGPNTLHSMQTVLDAIGAKIKRSSFSQDHGRNYEFQVSFNDRIGNDFNTLFEFLPPNRQYFVAAVPGSFYSRLFPQNSIHYFNSSLALHWLSRAPSGLLNKGRVHLHGGGAEAVAAYEGQFRADMAAFLEARAVELVPGGLLVMLFVCRHDWMDADAPRHDMWFPHIESILRELVAEGKVKEEDLDSFQLPVYSPTVGEFKAMVEMNGSFSIHVAKIVDQGWRAKVGQGVEDHKTDDLHEKARELSLAARAVFQEMVGNHFGGDVAEDLFQRFPDTAYQFFVNQPTVPTLPPTAFFILQKNA
ncbi:loganic acid O-methyltransferase-like [Nymphaea colorata]|nr:loganic acid O-methyltransferase-like [Nymphaea colorata]